MEGNGLVNPAKPLILEASSCNKFLLSMPLGASVDEGICSCFVPSTHGWRAFCLVVN